MREKYLDGLRGWAALVVVCYHTTLMLWGELALPFKPFFLDGPFSVFIFFVLSGYVLSVAAFRTGDRRAVVDMALRRYPRLAIPVFAISALALVFMHFGLMQNIPAGKAVGTAWWLSMFYTFEPSVLDMLHFSLWHVFVEASGNTYNSSLWTMPVELQGSFLIFAFLLAAGRSTTRRLLGHVIFIGATLWFTVFMFAMALGVAIANLVLLDAHRRLKESSFGAWLSWGLLAAGLYGASSRTDTYAPISSGLSAAAVVYAVLLNATIQRALSVPLSQWLGRISFPLYLVHIPVICSLASWAVLAIAHAGWMGAGVKVVLAVLTVSFSLVAAVVFAPIERLGIALGRRVSRAVLGSSLGPSTKIGSTVAGPTSN